MPGVQFGQQIDMNGFKITEVAAGVAATDAVNVSQLSALVDGFAATIGDGVNSSYGVVHNFGTLDVIVEVVTASGGNTVLAEVARSDANTVDVTFGAPVALNA